MSQRLPPAQGTRIAWADLPQPVHTWVAEVLRAPVVEAVSQQAGFSPGSADRVLTADGVRAFVKAVSGAPNRDSPDLHRREMRVTRSLPDGIPAPRLLAGYDDGDWVALLLEDVDGKHPVAPWLLPQVHAVLDALQALAERGTPAPVPGLRSAGEAMADLFSGWTRVAAETPPDLDSWTSANLHQLCRLGEQGVEALAGETLCHLDVRADNILLRADGSAVLVDWPWAARGPAWIDPLCLLLNVELYGGPDPEALIARSAALRETKPEVLNAGLAGLAGYFVDSARRPPSPGLPTLRAFQRAQGEAALGWLRRRLRRAG